MSKNAIVTILAIIGGFVVLGWVLKLSFKLLGLAIVVGIIFLAVTVGQKLVGGRR